MQKGNITDFEDKILNIIGDLNHCQIKELRPTPTNKLKNVITNINNTNVLTIFRNDVDGYSKPKIFAAQQHFLELLRSIMKKTTQTNASMKTNNSHYPFNRNNTYTIFP